VPFPSRTGGWFTGIQRDDEAATFKDLIGLAAIPARHWSIIPRLSRSRASNSRSCRLSEAASYGASNPSTMPSEYES
jgi:hypothetical protein